MHLVENVSEKMDVSVTRKTCNIILDPGLY